MTAISQNLLDINDSGKTAVINDELKRVNIDIPRTNVSFVAETATPTLDFIATNDAAPTELPEDVLHGRPWPMDAYDDDDDNEWGLIVSTSHPRDEKIQTGHPRG